MVNAKVRVAVPVAFVAVIVQLTVEVEELGDPEIKPVAVLKESPGEFEIAGEIEQLAIVPPVEEMVYPETAVPTMAVSEDCESVNAGFAKGATIFVTVLAPQSAVYILPTASRAIASG